MPYNYRPNNKLLLSCSNAKVCIKKGPHQNQILSSISNPQGYQNTADMGASCSIFMALVGGVAMRQSHVDVIAGADFRLKEGKCFL